MTKIIAIANQKGGVGKTTSTVNLAYALSNEGKRVLVVDIDPQGNLTQYLDNDPRWLDESKKTIYYTLVEEKPLSEILIKGKVDLIPTGILLAESESTLMMDYSGATVLKHALTEIQDNYDLILIDCPPTLGMLFVNALAAAQWVLIPVKTDSLSLSGIPNLATTVSKIKRKVNPALTILGVLPTMYNVNHNHDNEALNELHDQAKTVGIMVFDPINRSTNYDKSADERIATVEAYPHTNGVQNYVSLARKIINL